jgi:hypothetical protein
MSTNAPQQDPSKEFEKLLREKLEAIDFNFGDDSPRQELLSLVLNHHSLSSLNCDFENYKKLQEAFLDTNKSISVYLVAFVLNGIEKLSPQQTGLFPERYLSLCQYVHDKGIEWNEIVKPIKTSIMRKIESDANLGGRIIKPKAGLKVHR